MNIAKAPWTVENEECGDIISDDLCILSASPEFRMVATISRCFQGDRIPAMEAEHARLIAAAPDLLAALIGLDEAFCSLSDNMTREERHDARLKLIAARAAVAKAKGEVPA